MKKLIIFAFAITALVAGSAFAGDYHTGGTLYCNECHVMHGQQTHAYDSINGTQGVIVGAPHEYLLRQAVNDLCLSCHDGKTFAPDVMMADANSTTGGRLAGALNLQTVDDPTYKHEDGHTIGILSTTAPGGAFVTDATEGLKCVDCHTQHGRSGTSNAYRNLKADSTQNRVTYSVGTDTLTTWVYERVDPVVTGTAASFNQHYSTTNVDFNEPDETKSAYAYFCKGCHTDFHGSIGGAELGGNNVGGVWEEFERHPTAGVNLGAAGGGHSTLATYTAFVQANRVKVMNPDGVWDGTMTSGTPSCFSCHKSHGSSHSFGLIYPTDPKNGGAAAGSAINEDGSGSTYYGLCRQCHKQ